MKVIKRYKSIHRDGRFFPKVKDTPKKNIHWLILRDTTSYVLKSTPLWPISETEEGTSHHNPIKHVCSTLPSFTRKNSRQGEKWPAKGKIFGFHAPGLTFDSMSYGDRIFLKRIGDRLKSTAVELLRCRMVVGLCSPKRPHFLSGV